MRYTIVQIVFFLVVSFSANAQIKPQPKASDTQIAMQYYRQGEYEKAAEYYKKLYYTDGSSTYFTYYLNCLIHIESYVEAEKLLKNQVKSHRSELYYLVELGYVQSLSGNKSKAKSTYQLAIKKLNPNQHMIIRVANAFIGKRLFEYAVSTYSEGKKLMKGAYGFQMEMAQLYYYQRNYEKMISNYLDMLEISDRYLQQIQNYLQNAVYNDIDKNLKGILKRALLTRLNKTPEVTVFSELLIWLYIQDKDFSGAFIQAKALDKRKKENGQRIIDLARVATDNNDFGVAINAYEYVISKGELLEYFYAAKNELLEVMFTRIELGIDTQNKDFLRLEESYTKELENFGITFETIDMVGNLAHLKAFYLGKTAEALFLLEDAIATKQIDRMTKGKLELELADIYLVDGKVWDATFAYARVVENNKNNIIGADAKFRKAKLAYYIGNFEWSMAQLDVLKASTSKLVANDAAALSLFIYDNTGWDSTETALENYVRADFLHFKSKDSLALLSIDSLVQNYKMHAVADEAWFLKAKIHAKRYEFAKAEEAYKFVITNFYYDILADDALYALAQLYEHELANKEKAMECYAKLLKDFTDSIFTVEARKRYRILRGDKLGT